MWKYPLIVILLLSGCVETVSSVDALCEVPFPTFTEQELRELSERTLEEIDLYFARVAAVCG